MLRNHLSKRIGLPQILIAICVAGGAHAFAQAPTSAAGPPNSGPLPIRQPNGNSIEMPQNKNLPTSRQTGLNLRVDSRWINAFGYRPIAVTISSPQPTSESHSVRIRLTFGGLNVLSAEQEFELPSGATSASTTVSLPYYEQGSISLWWDAWVDGVKDADLSLRREAAQSVAPSVSPTSVKILVPASQVDQKVLVSPATSEFEALSLDFSEFPRRWMDYSCLDVVSLSVSDLQQLAKTNAEALEALLRWVRTGGYLWVSDVGDDLEKLPEVSKLLKVREVLLPPLGDPILRNGSDKDEKNDKAEKGDEKAAAPEATLIPPVEAGWRPSRPRFGGAPGSSEMRTWRRWGNDPRSGPRPDRVVVAPSDDSSASEETPFERRLFDSGQWYVEQRFGLGTLRAFRGPNEAAVFAHTPPANPSTIANASNDPNQLPRGFNWSLRSTRHWDSRHGLVPDASNMDFAKLLLPDVGRAPVTEFQVLITLFVLLIGPFNYWILKRYKRSQLLVLTVPLSAGIATAALFAYAIVADGFDTKVRVRSFTTIDQATGEAACWARMSYYAGLAPAAGLTMPADLAMYPILPVWGGDDYNTAREVVWGKGEELSRGWLSSRTPTQYLMVRSRKTPSRVDITAGNGKMQVVNRLGARIESLVALDESGTFFTGSGLDNESRVALKPIARDDATRAFGDIVRDNEPEMPAELLGNDRDLLGRRGRSRRVYARYRPQTGDSVMNENLAARALSDLAGMNGRPALELPARTYVAVTSTGPEVEIGIPHAKEDASFHVIVGRW